LASDDVAVFQKVHDVEIEAALPFVHGGVGCLGGAIGDEAAKKMLFGDTAYFAVAAHNIFGSANLTRALRQIRQ
jgi:hypothetical protein